MSSVTNPRRPTGITALSYFFVFGTLMSGLAAMMLIFRGGVLEPLWRLNPCARDSFIAMGSWALLLMAIVCFACAAAAVGLRRLTRWGFWTALIILATNLVGDLTNAFIGGDWRTLIGLPIGGLMLAYLIRQRHAFLR